MDTQLDDVDTSVAVLSLTGISKSYSGVAALSDVSLDVLPGEVHALLGENGAGKSTLIKSLLGLVPVLDGTATVLGRTPAEARDRVGYVPQTDALDTDFPVTATQVVMMGRYRRIGWWRPARAADRRAVREALELVGLADRAGKHFGTLSGGQRQRALLARAIAAEPELLLLDEPFNGVDVVSQEAIIRVLRELTAAGTALVLSTHDLTVARDLADIVSLINGRQWAAGPPDTTLTADNLRLAYGGHAIDLADGRTVLVDP